MSYFYFEVISFFCVSSLFLNLFFDSGYVLTLGLSVYHIANKRQAEKKSSCL